MPGPPGKKLVRARRSRVRVAPHPDDVEQQRNNLQDRNLQAEEKAETPAQVARRPSGRKSKVVLLAADEEIEHHRLAPATTQLNLDTQFERDIALYEKLQNEGEDRDNPDEDVEDVVLGEGQTYDDPDRILWSSEIDFLLSIIGFAVDVANIWNFPFLCVKYGGGLFLVPYLIILVTCGIPIFYMELLVGQYTRQGCISVWKLCPLFKGVGVCMTLVAFLVSFSYNVVLAWSLLYVYESTQAPLAWTRCGDASDHKDVYWTDGNCTTSEDAEKDQNSIQLPTAAEQFFKGKILELYEVMNRNITKRYSIQDLGHPDDSLSVILLLVYVILLLVLIYGIRVTGKVVWITATLPYLILGVLLFRGLTLPGAKDGLLYFMRADPKRLGEIDTWRAAGVQVFYSLGAGFGIHQTLSSFNKFHHNLLFDCIITAGVNTLTSILAGLVIFSFLGNMSYSIRAQVDQISVYAQGPQLVFELFPQAIGRIAGANFFSFIFFILVVMIGIDTSMCAIQSIQVAFIDYFKAAFNRHAHSKEVFMFVLLIVSYFFGLACVTHGGIYIFQVLDKNSATVSLIAATLLQCVGIAWVYGTQNLCDAAEAMTGQYPSIYFIVCWKFIAPLFLVTVLYSTFVEVLTDYPEFDGEKVTTPYFIVGICVAILPLLSVPIVAIWVLLKTKTSPACKNRFLLAISPEHEHEEILSTGIASRAKASHYLWIKCRRVKPTGPLESEQPESTAENGRTRKSSMKKGRLGRSQSQSVEDKKKEH